MSTTPSENWREEAMRQMELAEQSELEPVETPNELGIFFAKLGFLAVLSLGLVYFLGFGWLFAVLLVGWYLFWPR